MSRQTVQSSKNHKKMQPPIKLSNRIFVINLQYIYEPRRNKTARSKLFTL